MLAAILNRAQKPALLYVTFLCSWMPAIHSQGLSPTAFGNAGSSYFHPGNGITVEWVVGQMAFTTLDGGNGAVTQGMLQPLYAVPLPVELLDFRAARQSADRVRLDWSTAAEKNNSGFSVERRLDKSPDFSTIGFVPSHAAGGNSASPLAYFYTDPNPYAGITYYRLAQTDLDGKRAYSPVRAVSGWATTLNVEQWPNPAHGSFFVRISSPEKATGELTDPAGRLIQKIGMNPGNAEEFRVSTPGLYLLRVVTGSESRSLKIAVQ